MNKFGDFPFLVGVTSNRHAVKLENSTEAVADFICTKGVDGDLCILTPDGDKVLNTFGIYIDRCSDFDYLEKLRPVLVEKQLKLESSKVQIEIDEYCDEELIPLPVLNLIMTGYIIDYFGFDYVLPYTEARN